MKIKELIFYILGISLILMFILFYWTRFFIDDPSYAQPMLFIYQNFGAGACFLINIIIFLLFLIFIPYKTKIRWESKTVFAAFILALFAEMFGFPLFFFFMASSLDNTQILGLSSMDQIRNILFYTFHSKIIGAWMTVIGMGIILISWAKIYKAHNSQNFASTGLYRYIRHPQYLGLMLILSGWIIRWPTIITLIMFPILIIMYYRLAKYEEKEMLKLYGKKYEIYLDETSMFLPINFINKKLIKKE